MRNPQVSQVFIFLSLEVINLFKLSEYEFLSVQSIAASDEANACINDAVANGNEMISMVNQAGAAGNDPIAIYNDTSACGDKSGVIGNIANVRGAFSIQQYPINYYESAIDAEAGAIGGEASLISCMRPVPLAATL